MNQQNHIPPACPKCGESLTMLYFEGDWQFYRCDKHGTVVLTPQGQLQSEESDDSRIRR